MGYQTPYHIGDSDVISAFGFWTTRPDLGLTVKYAPEKHNYLWCKLWCVVQVKTVSDLFLLLNHAGPRYVGGCFARYYS